jgi:voltage-gated potassium channel
MAQLVKLLLGLRAAFSDAAVLSLMGVTATLITCASVFYHYVEGWGAIDSIYFAVMTISTVGYGDFSPQTVAGKIFTIGYVLVGLGVFVATASAIANVLIKTGGATESAPEDAGKGKP